MKLIPKFALSTLIFFCLLQLHVKGQAASTPDNAQKSFIRVDNLQFRDFNGNGKLDLYEDYRKSEQVRAADLLKKMNVEEKLAQLQCPWINKSKFLTSHNLDEFKAKEALKNGLGEILRLSDGNAFFVQARTPASQQVAELSNRIQTYLINKTRLGVPVLFLEEALHGLMVKDGTMFPSALGMSSSWNEELTKEIYQTIAKEARAYGTHRLLAPVVDIALDPRWGRTEETTGEDPYLTTRLGLVKVKALQGDTDTPDSNHVAATLKHFGAHGQPEGGHNIAPTFLSERQLREVHFKAFRTAIQEGKVLGVMASYNENSGIPTHSDAFLLKKLLRNEWGFKGVLISDYNATGELYNLHHIAKDSVGAALNALEAGVDVELADNFVYPTLLPLLKTGKISTTKIDEAVLNVLMLKFRLGLFERPFIDAGGTSVIGSPQHRELALKAAQQSMVLLKNDHSLLPLDRNKYRKIALIGPNADKCWLGGYSHLPRTSISPLAAIKEKYKDVEILYAPGCKIEADNATKRGPTQLASYEENLRLIKEAVQVAKTAEVVVLMLGGTPQVSKEATMDNLPGDLANLDLIGYQNELIDSLKALNKPIAAFVFSGPPISFVNLDTSAASIVQCWYLGQETGYAVAQTLFGDNNPSGKLTISIPRSAAHLPAYYFAKPTARSRGYNLEDNGPLYPFGFGLSYTNYEYSNLQLSKKSVAMRENVTVTVNVRNTGERSGDEIVQLYIRDEVSSVTRPLKELKDFARISLNPGEQKQVSFTIDPDKLKFYDREMREIVEPGEFSIMVGPSSEKLEVVKLLVQ